MAALPSSVSVHRRTPLAVRSSRRATLRARPVVAVPRASAVEESAAATAGSAVAGSKYIATNRFELQPDAGPKFEKVWLWRVPPPGRVSVYRWPALSGPVVVLLGGRAALDGAQVSLGGA